MMQLKIWITEGRSSASFVYEGGKNDYINWRKAVIYF